MSPRSLDPISRRPDKPDGKSGSSRKPSEKKSDDIVLPSTADREKLLEKAQASIQEKKNKRSKKRRLTLATLLLALLVIFLAGGLLIGYQQRKLAQQAQQKEKDKQAVEEKLAQLDVVKKLDQQQKSLLLSKVQAQYLAAQSVGLEPSATNGQDQKLLAVSGGSQSDAESVARGIQNVIDAKVRVAKTSGYYEGYIFYYFFGNTAIVWPPSFNIPGRGDPAALAADKQYATERSTQDKQKLEAGTLTAEQATAAILSEVRLRSYEDPNGSGPIASSLLPATQLSANGKVVADTIVAMDKPGFSDIKTLQYVSIYDPAKKPVDASFFFVKLTKVVKGDAIEKEYQAKLKQYQEQLK